MVPATYSSKELDLIRRTVAKDCDTDSKGINLHLGEFDLFISYCRALRLDPLRRQIYAFVFSKDDLKKRQLTIVTSIAGYRTIADRTDNYRPGECRCEIRDDLKEHDGNPAGIEFAEATVWKYSHGEWFSVTERAYWSEFAPVREVPSGGFQWVDTGDVYPQGHDKAGNPIKVKKAIGKPLLKLDERKDQWRKMPRVMLEKCAEAKALRRAWPDDFSGVYVEEEMDRSALLDATPSELADEAAVEQRLARIGGGNMLTIDWCDGNNNKRVSIGQFGDEALKWLRTNPAMAAEFAERNEENLREYWARDKSGALAVKKAIEQAKTAAGMIEAAE